MALQRYASVVDGTIPIQALLYTDEQLLASQEGVGIYDGLQKSPSHQAGIIHTTSHRLFYVDNKDPEYASFTLDLAYVSQTEYYAGLFTSSPKITLYLTGRGLNATVTSTSGALAIPGPASDPNGGTWECEVCGNKNRNPPGHSPSSTQVCELCGVPRPTTSTSRISPSHHLSSSLPSSSIHQPNPITPSTSPPTTGRQSSTACPACTFLNHPSLRECEICGTKLHPTLSVPEQRTKSAPATRPTSPDLDDDDDDDPVIGSERKLMKVSFRKGGDKPFYTVLKRSLKSKAWEVPTQIYKPSTISSQESETNATNRSGISGILRTVETSAQGRDDDLKNALQDLEALMIKARDMVRLAGELNEKLTSAASSSTPTPTPTPPTSSHSPSPSPSLSNPTTPSSSSVALSTSTNPSSLHELPEEATFIRSSLSQLGLQMTNVPVTNDMIKDEDKWISELAKELSTVLKGMMRDRGIVALDEVWGGWNRARGVALLPPSTFLQVIPHLPHHTSPPIHKRTFKSGLTVLHTPPYTPNAFSSRLISHLITEGPKTTMEVAIIEGITVALAKEMIDDAEVRGDVVRSDVEAVMIDDDGRGLGLGLGVGEAGVRWWPNLFAGYIWDGHVFSEEL
ncbi:hypothetical protein P691DRAFT_673987 [Macrolepiota fuliginosa MF-IS2]|uniref:Vacuolar protein-sorting-associated protein 36 n=1 Tax=Macrolepiota fuliginosa MF-IS2 TaxID=1400762 RepID=A0A9P6C2E3_9AGAR|nr:hypothetical protein P691DRAFT_673987 [Macrolepiota fuliginosa MF-IS2]